ncbi:MAG: queuosine precursor transporter [Kosmotogales bacterium]|nr:queuosine precursor transporter [Kosmotogales bacterium]
MNSLPNELLWFIFMVIDMSLAVLLFKFFKKQGLYLLIAVNIILANIQVVKVVELFGLSATLGNILYGSIFFSTDILSDIYGKKEAKKGVLIGFISLLLMTLYMQLSLYIKPANFEEAQVIQNSLESIFSLIPRIALGSIVAYFISQYTDVFIFHLVKSKTGEKKLWLRNNVSTMISQFIDSIIFVFIAFWGLYTMDVWWEILITTYLFKWIVAAVDTPFIYMAKRMIEKEKSKSL